MCIFLQTQLYCYRCFFIRFNLFFPRIFIYINYSQPIFILLLFFSLLSFFWFCDDVKNFLNSRKIKNNEVSWNLSESYVTVTTELALTRPWSLFHAPSTHHNIIKKSSSNSMWRNLPLSKFNLIGNFLRGWKSRRLFIFHQQTMSKQKKCLASLSCVRKLFITQKIENRIFFIGKVSSLAHLPFHSMNMNLLKLKNLSLRLLRLHWWWTMDWNFY